MTWPLTSPRTSNIQERIGKVNIFYDLVSEVSHNHVNHIFLIRSKSLSLVLVQGDGNQPPTLEGRNIE